MSNDEKLDLLLANVQNIKEDVQGVKEDVRIMKEDIHGLKEDVSGLKEDVHIIKGDIHGLKKDVSNLKDDVQVLQYGMEVANERIKTIEMTLENETNRNIRVIAEGHLNLDRKLDEALKSLQPNMMYQLKVNYLDSEVKKIKPLVGLK